MYTPQTKLFRKNEHMLSNRGRTRDARGRIVNAVSAISATIGNSLILLAIWRTPTLHTPSIVLLSGLALSDLAVGLIVQPLWIFYKITMIQRNRVLSSNLGSKWYPLSEMLTAVTFLTVCAVTFERFLALKLHLRYHELVTFNRLHLVLGTIWVSSSLFATWKVFHPPSSEVYEMAAGLLLILVAVWCNFKVFQIVRRHKSQIQVQAQISQHGFGQANIARYKKSVCTMKYIVGHFIVSYLPFFLFLVVVQTRAKGETPTFRVVKDYLMTFQYFNSCLNPILYCWRIGDIRQAVKEILKTPFQRN